MSVSTEKTAATKQTKPATKAKAAGKSSDAETKVAAKTPAAKPQAKGKSVKAETVTDSTPISEDATLTTEGSADTGTVSKNSKKVVAVADPEFTRRIKEILSGFDEVLVRIRESKVKVNEVNKSYLQQIKELNKRRKVKREGGTGKGNAFDRLSLVRDVRGTNLLHDFVGAPHGSRLARQSVTDAIHKYVTSEKLQSEENRKNFIPDAKLEKILGTEAERLAILEARKKLIPSTKITKDVGYFNEQTFLKPWFYTQKEEAKLNLDDTTTQTLSASAST